MCPAYSLNTIGLCYVITEPALMQIILKIYLFYIVCLEASRSNVAMAKSKYVSIAICVL